MATGKSGEQGKRQSQFGEGGSSEFGLFDDWHAYTQGQVLLGGSMRFAIIPELSLWPGSALVVDPDGTNAAVTAATSGVGGGLPGRDVHVVDPFEIVDGVKRARFNPLASIKLDSLTAKEDVYFLTEALIPPEALPSAAKHFEEAARLIVAGVIAFVVVGGGTLVDVRNALLGDAASLDKLFGQMLQSDAAGGVSKAAATLVANAEGQELGSMMTTVLRHTSWIDSGAMKTVLQGSDFEMADLKKQPTSIYLVLPSHMLNMHQRFLRMFINMMRNAVPGGKSAVPILMIL